MAELHNFRVVAWWASGRTGIAKCSSAPSAIHFTSPPALGGVDGRWTPEDLLLCAIASSYTITFRTLAENLKFEYTDLQVELEGTISKGDTGYSFGQVIIRPHLMISNEAERERALKLLHKADAVCLVARALSIDRKFEPTVQVKDSRMEVAQPASVSEK